MTMDVQKSYHTYDDTSPDAKVTNLSVESARTSHVSKTEMQSTILGHAKTSKRSFDVAFLMMPDEKLRQKQPEKQLRVSKQLFAREEWEQPPKKIQDIYENVEDKLNFDDNSCGNNNMSPSFGSDGNIDVGTDEYPNKTLYCSDSENSDRSRSRPNSNESAAKPKFLPESPYKNKIFDDPAIISMQTRARYDPRYSEKMAEMSPKSAFTKVANYALRSPHSVSPDNLMYQNSISPPLSAGSPPSNAFNKPLGFNNLLSSAHLLNSNNFFKNQNLSSPTSNYGESAMSSRAPAFNKMDYQDKNGDGKSQQIANKLNFLPFRPDMPSYLPPGSAYPFAVQNFQSPSPDFIKLPVQPREPVNSMIVNPAAALLSTLLPPTLAAFSLPAQNVCAKCNISFRMTSDLVYHMRTHHKSESVADPNRRKREEKLKCLVCNESFRERHHLTRHMTAHQDKEGDLDDLPQNCNKKSKQYFGHNGSSVIHK